MIYALTDTWYIVLRDLRTRIRMPIFIFMTMFQPILWLVLFTQIFKSLGGSLSSPQEVLTSAISSSLPPA